jgi:hypothetical protein
MAVLADDSRHNLAGTNVADEDAAQHKFRTRSKRWLKNGLFN